MAMVHILHHDESIYNVEKKEAVELKKMPLYHSKFEKQVRFERAAVKEGHRTMGFNAVPLKKTDEFLRKGSGVRYSVEKKVHTCPCKKKEPVPKKTSEEPQKSNKNFKTENIKRVVSAAPKKFTPRFTDTRHGVLHDLKRSGLMPVYIYQPKFGKLPPYLIKRMREMQILQEQLKDVETQEKPLCRYITQEERAELLGVTLLTFFFSNLIIQNCLGIET